MRFPAGFHQAPNRIAIGVTACAALAVAAWSTAPMRGSHHYAANVAGRPSIRNPISFEGFSAAEPWGRWTVSERATVTFGRPLPRSFALVVRARAFGPNIGAPVRICARDACATAAFAAVDTDVRLTLATEDGVRTLVFHVPSPTAPGNGDVRPLGIGLTSVGIERVDG